MDYDNTQAGDEIAETVKNVQRAKNFLLLLLAACLVFGGITICIAFAALNEARRERPETTIREIRFKLVELESEKYRVWQACLSFMKIGSHILTVLTIVAAFRLLFTLKLRKNKMIFCCIGLIFPCTSIFFMIYLLCCAHGHVQNGGKL